MKAAIWVLTITILIFAAFAEVRAERIYQFFDSVRNIENLPEKTDNLVSAIIDQTPLKDQDKDYQVNIHTTIKKSKVKIRVSRTDLADVNMPHDLIYFLDGRALEVLRDITLPYVLKKSFRGISGGKHVVGIKVIDSNERVGINQVEIKVVN